MGSMINSIPKMFRRMNDGILGRMKWMKIVSNSQTIPVKEVHFNATEIETCQILERKKILSVISSTSEQRQLWVSF